MAIYYDSKHYPWKQGYWESHYLPFLGSMIVNLILIIVSKKVKHIIYSDTYKSELNP